MTTTDIIRSHRRQARHEDARHLFTVGQAVRMRRGFGVSVSPTDLYHIISTLPPRGGSPQYRIRNDEERHERMTTQDCLEPVGAPQSADAATLIERTFGDGQGTKTR